MVLDIVLYATVALAAVGGILYVVGTYNQMVTSARDVDRHFANVEVSLRQRHDEIPGLVGVCRGYMVHERELLERVASLRARFESSEGSRQKVETENELRPNVGQLVALAEAYPDLKANELFSRIADRLSGIENEIADRRELFNASVTAYNTYIQVLPQRLFAQTLGFEPHPLLQVRGS